MMDVKDTLISFGSILPGDLDSTLRVAIEANKEHPVLGQVRRALQGELMADLELRNRVAAEIPSLGAEGLRGKWGYWISRKLMC